MNVIAISNQLYSSTSLMNKDGVAYVMCKEDLTAEKLHDLSPEYVFFPHWSYIIPPEIYNQFNCVIFHMTDLPFGRGGSPLQNLIIRGIYNTKISAIRCSSVIDGGDVFLKADFDIESGSASEIYKRAGETISSMIDRIVVEKPTPTPQIGAPVVFDRRTPAESEIVGITTPRQLYDFIRMLDAPGYPKAFCVKDGLRFEFSNAQYNNGCVTATVTAGGSHV